MALNKNFILLSLILCALFSACKKSSEVSTPALADNQSGASNGSGGSGGGGGGGISGDAWWDKLTSFDHNVTYKYTPTDHNSTDPDVLTSDAVIHEYAPNKLVVYDVAGWSAPVIRFLTVNSDNTTTIDGVTLIPYDNDKNNPADGGNNIIQLSGVNKMISTRFFKPIGGSTVNDISLLSFDPTARTVSIDSFYPTSKTSAIALNSDESKLLVLEADTPADGEITWKVLNTQDLAAGPLASGTFNFSSLFPGPAYTVDQIRWGLEESNLIRIRNNDFIFSCQLNVNDTDPKRVYDSFVMVHIKLNSDNTVTADNFKKDIVSDSDFNVLQYVDNTFIETDDVHYLRRIDDDHFALSGRFDMRKEFFGGNWSTDLQEAFIYLGKLENNGSITLGAPELIKQNTGGDYPYFWVYPDTHEIVLVYESDYGEDHYFARQAGATMPLTNFTLHGYAQDAIARNEPYFVANAAALPADPTQNGNQYYIHTAMDTGFMYAWNLDTSSWVHITQVDVSMLNQDGLGFDLSLRSSWGTPIWIMTYDTSTLSITRKKIAAEINETADYRNTAPELDDLWRFKGTKMADGRIAMSFSSSGKIQRTSNTSSHFLILSK